MQVPITFETFETVWKVLMKVAIVGLCVAIVWLPLCWSGYLKSPEITLEQYAQVVQMLSNCPQLKAEVARATLDDRITRKEYHALQNAYNQMLQEQLIRHLLIRSYQPSDPVLLSIVKNCLKGQPDKSLSGDQDD